MISFSTDSGLYSIPLGQDYDFTNLCKNIRLITQKYNLSYSNIITSGISTNYPIQTVYGYMYGFGNYLGINMQSAFFILLFTLLYLYNLMA